MVPHSAANVYNLIRHSNKLESFFLKKKGQTLVLWALFTAYNSPTPSSLLFLLRPGDYTGTTNDDDDDAFSLTDVCLFMGTRHLLDLARAPIPFLKAATSVNLCFTTQKNQVQGESVSLGPSGHPLCCPVQFAIRRVLTHPQHFDATATPLPLTTMFAF